MINVLTPNGWSPFKGVKRSSVDETLSIKFDDGSDIVCTNDHLIKVDDGFVEARKIDVPYKKTNTEKQYVYDLLEVDKGHIYNTNGIVSHNCKFRGSQNSLLTAYVLESLYSKVPLEEYEEGLKVFYEPEKEHFYVMVCDVSRGMGKDYHAFTVIDISTRPYEVVCSYRNNRLSPLIYPNVIHNAAMKYNEAMVLVELNDIGEQVANTLFHDVEYENIIMVDKYKNRQVIAFGPNALPGVKTSTSVKSVGCSNIKSMVEGGHINVNDMEIIDELGTFVEKGKSYEADKGAHDDLVMTLVLFAWMTTQEFFIEISNKDLRNMVLSDIEEQQMENICPFGFIESSFYSYSGDDDFYTEFYRDDF